MKLQFAFGNPRAKAGKKGKRKSVAKRHKRRKTSSVKANLKKAVAVAKKHRKGKVRVKRKGKRKNPQAAMIRKNGKVIGREFSPLSARESKAAEGIFVSLMKQYKAATPMSAERGQLLRKMQGLKTKLGKHSSFLKTLQRYEEDKDVKISKFDLAEKKEKTVAKKRRKKRKGSKKVRRHKKAKAAAPKKHKRRKSRRKSGKRKSHKRRKHAKVSAAPKKARRRRKSGKRKGSKKRRSHVRRSRKVMTLNFTKKIKRGKRSVTVSGRIRANPYRRNPLADKVKTYSGMSTEELGALALGGALVPVVNGLIGKVPGGASIVSTINSVVGAQAVGSVLPIAVGVGLNAIAEHAPIGGQGKKYAKMAGEGLVAAGLIGLVIGLAQKYINPALGLSGINYTPNMRGINFTPNMGIMPQLNGMGARGDYGGNAGYHQSRADFGIMPQLNGMGDVRNSGDFGADSSSDSEYDTDSSEGDAHTTSMN